MEENYFIPSLDKPDTPQGNILFKDNLFLEINRILLLIGTIVFILFLGYLLINYDVIYVKKSAFEWRGWGEAIIGTAIFIPTFIFFIIDKFYIYNKVLMSKNISVIFRLNKFFLIGFPFTTHIPYFFFYNLLISYTVIFSPITLLLDIIVLITFLCALILDMKLSNDFIKRYKQENLTPSNYNDPNVG
jgi:hypothetical protein